MIWIALALFLQPMMHELVAMAMREWYWSRKNNAVDWPTIMTEASAEEKEMKQLTLKALRKAAGESKDWEP